MMTLARALPKPLRAATPRREVLEVGAEGEIADAEHGVDAAGGVELDGLVAAEADDVEVVAGAAAQDVEGIVGVGAVERVVAAAALESVGALQAGEPVGGAIADDDVVVGAAGAVDGGGAGKGEVLDALGEDEGHRAFDTVVEAGAEIVKLLVDPIADIVDDVDVIAGAAVHGVGAGAAIEAVVCRGAEGAEVREPVIAGAADERVGAVVAVERIGAGIADDQVVQSVAAAGGVGGAGQRQVLDAVADAVADRTQHQVVPPPPNKMSWVTSPA